MKPLHGLLVIVLGVAVAAGVSFWEPRQVSLLSSDKETRLEQVKRTGILRCGYAIWPPFNTKDPNTGKLGGVAYELVEEIGRQLKVKIEWKGEVSTGEMLSDLNLNRYDMICSTYAETPSRAREADFAGPLMYTPVYMYVRKDDGRFDQDFGRADDPSVRFATLDGGYSAIAANERFPRAAKISLPQMSSPVDGYMMVATGKADAILQDPYTFAAYDAQNSGLLRPAGNKPFLMIAIGMPIPANEPAFKAALNTTIAYLHDSGFIKTPLQRAETPLIKFFNPARPYASESAGAS